MVGGMEGAPRGAGTTVVMGTAIWLFTLLFVVPTALDASLGGVPMLAYLFALNVAAGCMFWTRRTWAELGEKTVAVLYLASGVFFFSVLVDPVRIDSAGPGALARWSDWEDALRRKVPDHPRLEGGPVAQGAVARRTGASDRTWIEGLFEDVVLPPERPR